MHASRSYRTPKIFLYSGSDSVINEFRTVLEVFEDKLDTIRLEEFGENSKYLSSASETPGIFVVDVQTDSNFSFIERIREASPESVVIGVLYDYTDPAFERARNHGISEIAVLGERFRTREVLKRALAKLSSTPDESSSISSTCHDCSVIKEYIQDAVVVVDPNGNISSFNRAAEQLFGYAKSEILGKHISTIYPPECQDLSQIECVDVIRREMDVDIDTTAMRKDGTKVLIRLTLTMAVDSDGNPKAMIGIARRRGKAGHVDAPTHRLAAIVESSDDAIIAKKLDGTILSWNKGAKKIFGYEAAEVIGKPVSILMPPEKSSDMPMILSRIKRGESVDHFQTQRMTRDGRIIEVSVTVSPVMDSDGNVIGGAAIIRDVTLEKMVEDASNMQLEFLQDLFDAIPHPVFFKDSKMVYRFCNDAFAEFLGLERSEILGSTVFDIAPADLAQVYHDHDMELFESGGKQIYESNVSGSDGSIKTVEFNKAVVAGSDGSKRGIVGTILDLTEWKKAINKVADSDRRYQEILKSVIEGIGIVDVEERIIYCNPAFSMILDAHSPEDVIGENLLDFIPEDQREKILRETRRRMKGDHSRYEIDIVSMKKKRKTVQCSISPRLDANGDYIGAFGAIVDVTETRRLQDVADRAGKLETVGLIVGQVAHDFNNLLGPLMAYPELIRDELPKDHNAFPLLDDIEKAASQISEINQQLLTLGRRGHYNLEPVDLNTVVERAINDVILNYDELTVQKNLSSSLARMNGGHSQLYRGIGNLIINAIEATEGRGTLSVSTSSTYVNGYRGKLGTIPKGEYIKLTISDDGHGIDVETFPHIFEPFFSTKPAGTKRGAGLGLSIVSAVVEDHDAYIDCRTSKDGGTTFIIYFPTLRKGADQRSLDSSNRANEKILVVDDDPVQRNVIKNLLSRVGYEVTTVASGEEALGVARETRFDIVLLDVVMPGGMDGVDTYEELLKINPGQKAIIISGYALTDRVERANELGAGQFIRKPVTLNSLTRAVKHELSCTPDPQREESLS